MLMAVLLATGACSSPSKKAAPTTSATVETMPTTSSSTPPRSITTVTSATSAPPTSVSPVMAPTTVATACAAGPFGTEADAAAFISTKTVGSGTFAAAHWYVLPLTTLPFSATADLSALVATLQHGTGSSPAQVFFFHQGCYLGTATATFRIDFRVEAVSSSQMTVTWGHYGPSDPMCCPSGQPWVVTFTWRNGHLETSGTFPPEDQRDP